MKYLSSEEFIRVCCHAGTSPVVPEITSTLAEDTVIIVTYLLIAYTTRVVATRLPTLGIAQ